MENHKILITDDDPRISSTIVESFEKQGYDYYFYQSLDGETALRLAREKKPELILIDWKLPGISGLEVVNSLKNDKATQDILAIMITGVMTSIDNLKSAFDAGVVDFIRKPIEPADLIARVRSMLMLSAAYKKNIDLKNQELMNATMRLTKNNEFHINLVEKLKELDGYISGEQKEEKNIISSIISEINMNTKEESWEQFEMYFKQSHPEFIDNLLGKYPDLTPSEIKLCTFLRLNLRTKEIAAITFQEPHSIRIARSRLRKKMGLSREENLATHLMTL
jgi:DNA-binding response OmpR family regulator